MLIVCFSAFSSISSILSTLINLINNSFMILFAIGHNIHLLCAVWCNEAKFIILIKILKNTNARSLTYCKELIDFYHNMPREKIDFFFSVVFESVVKAFKRVNRTGWTSLCWWSWVRRSWTPLERILRQAVFIDWSLSIIL